MRTALALSAVALLVCACEQPLPPEERGTIVVPATPQATGADAPLVAPSTPYATSQTTQTKQEESGYFPTAGSPLVPETSAAFSIRGPNRALMRGELVASNPAVYSNRLYMTQPNLWRIEGRRLPAKAASGSTVPPQPQERIVFFDFDEYSLTPEGHQIIDVVAQTLRSDKAAQVKLVGKADRSGTDPYNMALSQRRAEAVRGYLVERGVAATQIDTQWVGEREPPVPTADGVREARNRVVEMSITGLSGGSAPQQAVEAWPTDNRILFTNTEEFPPGFTGRLVPDAQANGTMLGQ